MAVVDDQPFGGTCANRGCDPKKVLVGAADVVSHGITACAGSAVAGRRVDRLAHADGLQAHLHGSRSAIDGGVVTKERGSSCSMARRDSSPQIESRSAGANWRAGISSIATGASPKPLGIPGESTSSTRTAFHGCSTTPSPHHLLRRGIHLARIRASRRVARERRSSCSRAALRFPRSTHALVDRLSPTVATSGSTYASTRGHRRRAHATRHRRSACMQGKVRARASSRPISSCTARGARRTRRASARAREA